MDTDKRIENLLVVTAVEMYARRHEIDVADVLQLFREHNIVPLIRQNYATLHTLDLFEAVNFAEDVIKKNNSK
ncbi:MAG: DUF3791 domain-containing protein [Planctomycetaceae bacterium]|jgi:uncharacterized protein (DUF433 family)|nr:DUF3791 domain-containing protein [Planctomycetaceae bacterium]